MRECMRYQCKFSCLHFYLWCTHSVKALCTSGPAPGYHWVGFLSSVTEVPWLKRHQFWLLARSLSRTASSCFSLSSLLAFFFLHASFLSSLVAFSHTIPFSFAFGSVSRLKFRASLLSLLKHFTPFCHSLCSFPLLGPSAS